MRGMFGLVSLLIGVALMFYLFTKNTSDVLRVSKPIRAQAVQISGRGQDGQSAEKSFQVDPEERAGRLDALLVTDVTPGGAADTFYGLKKGDRIIAISVGGGLQKVNDAANGDPGMAKAMLAQYSFAASQPIVVQRNGQTLTLPLTDTPGIIKSPAPAPAPTAGNPTATPQPAQPAQAQPAQAPAQPGQQPSRNIWDQAHDLTKQLQQQ